MRGIWRLCARLKTSRITAFFRLISAMTLAFWKPSAPTKSTSSCIWRRKAMSTVQSMVLAHSSKRILSAHFACSMRRSPIGGNCLSRADRLSVFITFQRMKCLAICLSIAVSSRKKRHISRRRLIQHPKPHPIIWCVPGMRPMACQSCCPIARTIMGRSISLKS